MARDWDAEDRKRAEEMKKEVWELRVWVKQPALVPKEGNMYTAYVGQEFDPEKYSIVEGGWDHDHCEFCWKRISDYVDESGKHPSDQSGYTNGNHWICKVCYEKYFQE